MDPTIALVALLALAALLGVSACDAPQIAWFYRFDDADVRERTAVLEVSILAGGCDGAPVYTQTFARDEDAATPPALPDGRYGVEVIARDAQCRVVGRACEPIEGAEREIHIVVARTDEGDACDAGEVCDRGRCAGGDSGVPPCGCVDDAGACRPGDEIGACGSGGGSCEVCCGGGIDTCEAGLCMPLSSRRVTRVSAGARHTCVLLERGEVFCWGSNDDGQLAAGDLSAALEPLQIGSAPDWTAVHGAHASVCGLRRGGGLRCWGWNFSAQIGTGTRDPLRVAVEQPISPPEPLVEIEANRFHSCGLTAGGSLYCWGGNGVFALWQDATGDFAPTAVQTPAGAPASWDAVRLGLGRTCALHDGQQWCAGYAIHGRIGVPEAALAGRSVYLLEEATQVAPEIRWSELAIGVAHNCGLDDAGRLYCWGCGGDCDPATDRCDPMNVDSSADVRDCSYALGRLPESGWYVELPSDGFVADGPFLAVAASEHSCVILDDGGGDGAGPLVCFGPNEEGQLGDGTTARHGYDPSHTVLRGARFRAVSTGLVHTCAIRETGALYCWGFGDDRALGTTELEPVDAAAHEARMRQRALTPRRACID